MARKPPLAPASRSQGTRSLPASQIVRFTEAMNTRLHAVVEREGKTIQSYIQAATVAALDESDRKHRERESLQEETPSYGKRQQGPAASSATRGYGLRQKMELLGRAHTYEEPEPEPTPPPSMPQIVIAQAPATPAMSEVDRLAAYVVTGDPDKRQKRHEAAADIIGATAKDLIEKAQLAKALDDKILVLEGQKPKSVTVSLFESFFGNK